ncbi:MAG TPA: hypothetical protein VHP30_04785 [Ignavibacteriales bacterium]|nr:hypothetical protein [Ignavibacteriales bacterium]
MIRKALLLFFCAALAIFMYACAAAEVKPLYTSDYPLTDDFAYSLSTDFSVRIPEGWFTSEDNECKCIDLWLIRDDFSATISFAAIDFLSSGPLNQTQEDVMKEAVLYSKAQRMAKLQDKFTPYETDEYFKIRGEQYAAYQYIGDEGLPIRVVLFSYKGRYFEASAIPTQQVGSGIVTPAELFRIQQTVISSIK